MNWARATQISAAGVGLLFVACSDPSDSVDHSPGWSGVIQELASATLTLPPDSADTLRPSGRMASGDFDGDGVSDLILGVPGHDGPDKVRTDAGAAFVLPGKSLTGEPDVPSIAVLTIIGAVPGDNLGFSVAAGDLNSDGMDDVIVGAIGSNGIPEIRTDMGEVYVIFGGPGVSGIRDVAEREFDLLVQPAEGFSQLGSALAAGDVNNDGIDDLVAGAPFAGRMAGSPVGGARTTVGEVYAIYGEESLGGEISVAEGEEDVLLAGGTEFDQFGTSLAVGDVNGDSIADIAVGAPGFDPSSGLTEAGAAFVFAGGNLQGKLPAAAASERLDGMAQGGRAGDAVLVMESAGSLLVSAPAEGIAERAGCGVVRLEEATYMGSTAGESFPGAVASVTPGQDDLLIFGSPLANGGAGAVFLVEASTSGEVDMADPPKGSRVLTGQQGLGLGNAVAAGDYDDDGRWELAVLASPTDTGASAASAGAVYIVEH